LTYVGDDVEFGRLQGKLLDMAFGGKKAKVAYVMGFAGTSPQILRAKGWDVPGLNRNRYPVLRFRVLVWGYIYSKAHTAKAHAPNRPRTPRTTNFQLQHPVRVA
jgi:hypothetical protein